MNQLGVARAQNKELLAIVELGDDHCAHCFADGVQMITGCTFGKGNIRMVEAARACGASAQFTGSGGAIVGTYTDNAMFAALQQKLEPLGIKLLKPQIV